MAAGQRDKASSTPDQSPGITRRQLMLDGLVGLAFAGPLLAALVAAVRYVLPPAKAITGATERVEVARTDELADDQSKDFLYNGAPHILIRLGEEFRAFDKKCTHLGCLVNWEPDQRVFHCPCHDAIFDSSGRVVSGPAPRPLPALVVEVSGGKVYVKA